MSAAIQSIKISNFRSCVDTEITLSQYTALIGYNNSGKSNILTAIQWLLRKTSLSISDFSNASNDVSISGTFGGITIELLETLSPTHRSRITPYISNSSISIRRTQGAPDVKAAEIILSVFNPATSNWDPNPTGIDNAINALFPEPIRIGAMENATEDASKAKTTTTIGKLLAQFLNPIRVAHEAEINTHLEEIKKRISADGDHRLPELGTIDTSINEKISDIFPDIILKLDFNTPSFDDLIKAGSVKLYEGDGNGMGFSSYGHGAQRSIQMALVRHLAEIKQGGTTANTTLLLIDEPELYLHPFAIEHIREALKTLSLSGYQVIFSTHSGQMIQSDDAANTVLVRKNSILGTHTRRRLMDAIQSVVTNSTHQIEHIFSLSNSSQILFSEQVILAEGKTELRLMPILFKIIKGKTLAQHKFALVTQDGVDNTKKSRDILEAMDIPSKAVVDLDYAFRGAIQHGYLQSTDPDVIAIKAIFPALAAANGFSIDPNTNLPKKNALYSSADAYEILAVDTTAALHIQNLHQKLKPQGIWIWTDGAVEKTLNLPSKTESAWAAFVTSCKNMDTPTLNTTHPQLISLFNWISP